MIELRQFRQFIAVAEELSFRRAADRLHMAQPPLTVTIKQIEEELGTLLIERTNRIARLTPAGRVFLEECKRTVVQAERAMVAARRAGAGLNGALRVTFVASAAREILPAILRAFREQYPQVELMLTEAMTAQQVAKIQTDEADVGFVIPPLRDADGLSVEVLAKNQMVAALPENHPLAQLQSIALSDLASEDWIIFPERQGPGLHERVLTACAQAGFVPRVGQQASQMDTIASLVAGGMGVGLVTRIIATANRPGVVFRDLTGVGTPVEYELAIAYGRSTPLVDAFMAVIRSRANSVGSAADESFAPKGVRRS
jgi:DNA-binding transcriptional LysR family regulator